MKYIIHSTRYMYSISSFVYVIYRVRVLRVLQKVRSVELSSIEPSFEYYLLFHRKKKQKKKSCPIDFLGNY